MSFYEQVKQRFRDLPHVELVECSEGSVGVTTREPTFASGLITNELQAEMVHRIFSAKGEIV